MQCFELNIYVTSDATEQNTQTYLEYLASKIKEQRLSHIVFSNFNPFFETIPELGFIADPTNKAVTGPFKYRLFLPSASISDEDNDSFGLINFVPIRMHRFADNCNNYHAYAPIEDDKTLLLSASWKSNHVLEAVVIKTKG